jgi:hypothetical protein
MGCIRLVIKERRTPIRRAEGQDHERRFPQSIGTIFESHGQGGSESAPPWTGAGEAQHGLPKIPQKSIKSHGLGNGLDSTHAANHFPTAAVPLFRVESFPISSRLKT